MVALKQARPSTHSAATFSLQSWENLLRRNRSAAHFSQSLQRARYYDPSNGEFTSRDYVQYVDGMSLMRSSLSLHFTDPGGTIPPLIIGGCALGLLFLNGCNSETEVDVQDEPPSPIPTDEDFVTDPPRSCRFAIANAFDEWDPLVRVMKEKECWYQTKCIDCRTHEASRKLRERTARTVAFYDNGTEPPTLFVCLDKCNTYQEIRAAIHHEFVHAYDDCVFGFSGNNCRKIACSEVRAYSYGTDCDLFPSGDVRDEEYRKLCVARLAKESTKGSCPRSFEADVVAVLDRCYISRDLYNSKWLHGLDGHFIY